VLVVAQLYFVKKNLLIKYTLRLHTTGYTLQVTHYRLHTTGYKLQVTHYRLHTTGYKLQVTH